MQFMVGSRKYLQLLLSGDSRIPLARGLHRNHPVASTEKKQCRRVDLIRRSNKRAFVESHGIVAGPVRRFSLDGEGVSEHKELMPPNAECLIPDVVGNLQVRLWTSGFEIRKSVLVTPGNVCELTLAPSVKRTGRRGRWARAVGTGSRSPAGAAPR